MGVAEHRAASAATRTVAYAVLTVSDEYGNKGSFKGAFSVADVPSAQPSSVDTRRAGFSPTSTSVKNTLDLLLTAGSKADMKAAAATVVATKGASAKLGTALDDVMASVMAAVDWVMR